MTVSKTHLPGSFLRVVAGSPATQKKGSWVSRK